MGRGCLPARCTVRQAGGEWASARGAPVRVAAAVGGRHPAARPQTGRANSGSRVHNTNRDNKLPSGTQRQASPHRQQWHRPSWSQRRRRDKRTRPRRTSAKRRRRRGGSRHRSTSPAHVDRLLDHHRPRPRRVPRRAAGVPTAGRRQTRGGHGAAGRTRAVPPALQTAFDAAGAGAARARAPTRAWARGGPRKRPRQREQIGRAREPSESRRPAVRHPVAAWPGL